MRMNLLDRWQDNKWAETPAGAFYFCEVHVDRAECDSDTSRWQNWVWLCDPPGLWLETLGNGYEVRRLWFQKSKLLQVHWQLGKNETEWKQSPFEL